MKQTVKVFLAIIAILSPFIVPMQAQDNLSVSFENLSAVPDFLNICGDNDTEVVVVGLAGGAAAARQNIVATANLFKGVQFEAFDTLGSTPGVTYDASNPNQPIFFLPDIDRFTISEVRLSFSISANCDYVDTLANNDAIVVADSWHFSYQLNGVDLEETDVNTEYRDAFAVTSLTMDIDTTYGPSRVGDCFTRDIVITNTALSGFTDTVYYTNTQGPGITISSIEVNGIAVAFTKQVAGTDTLIVLKLDSTLFTLNTLGALPGDGDGFLDKDESVTITESLCVLTCEQSRASIHTASWGCDGRYCNTSQAGDFVRIGEGEPNVDFFDFASVANVDVGYCQAGVSAITFENNGVESDPGFATMVDVALGAGIGSMSTLADNGYTITAVEIAGITIASPTYPYTLEGDPNFFMVDPDGPGGLMDFDGDDYFDDLPAGEAIEIILYYEFDCSLGQEIGNDTTCANNFNTIFSARIDYTNACNERIERAEDGYAGINNNRSEYENLTDTDAFLEEDTFFVMHTETRTIRFFDRSCSGNELIRARVVMPSGVSPVISETMLLQEAYSFPIAASSVVGDTLILDFDASFVPFLNGEYVLLLAFEADCSTSLGPTVFPTRLSFECPDCVCSHWWYCGDIAGPQLHANIPPCPPDVFECPMGVRTYAFDVNRTTLGFTDSTYTTPINPDSANLKVAIACDSVQMRVLNVLGDSVVNLINDSLGVVISYDNIDETPSLEQTFLFDYADIRMVSGGIEYNCRIDTSDLTVIHDDVTKILNFDLESCLTTLGLTLLPGDTVDFVGHFTVNKDAPILFDDFRSVPNFRGYGYAVIDDVEMACDNFGEAFSLSKTEATFTFPYSTIFPSGCEDKFLEYRLNIVDNEFTDWFGSEARQSIHVDSMVIIFDTAVLDGFSMFEPEVIIPGHPVYGNSPIPMPGFDQFPDGRYVVHFDTLATMPALATAMTTPFNFRIRVIPNCQTATGSSMGSSSYDFDPAIYFTDRYYARLIGDGSCANQTSESADNDIQYSEPPTFSLLPITNPNVFLAGDTVSWVLQHCNTSLTSDAGITWIGFEDSTESIVVVSVEDITNPANITSLPVVEYRPANNYFSLTDGLRRANGVNSFDDRCNTLRVKAVVVKCGTTNFTARTGYNCIMFPDSANWNPEIYAPCLDVTTNLSVTTLDPFLEADVIEQPLTEVPLCDTSAIGILVRNNLQGIAYDVSTQIILPMDGIEIVPGSIEFSYPSGAPYVSVPANPVFVGTNSRGRIFEFDNFSLLNTYLDQNGLPGSSAIAPTDSNEFRIRYKFVTDCDFVSGSITYYNLRGIKGCGTPTNLESGETLPFQIQGASAGAGKLYDVYFDPQSGLAPQTTGTVRIIAKNLTNAPSDSTLDKITLRLPNSMTYQNNSSIALEPANWTGVQPQLETMADFYTLTWCLPNGLLNNDSAIVEFSLLSPDLDCSIQDTLVELFTITKNTVSCTNGGLNCPVDAITSTNNGQLTALPVNQRLLDFAINTTSICQGSGIERVTVDGYIVNYGPDMMGSPINIFYYNDLNADSTFDIGEPELANFTLAGPMNAQDSIAISHSFDVDFNLVCNIVGLIDSTGLGLCDITQMSLGDVELQNAGDNEVFCAATPTTITRELGDANCNAINNYTYNWTALTPASTADLSASNIPNPILNVPHNAMQEDTLYYILETTRNACGISTQDTVRIIRATTPMIDPAATVFISLGDSTVLNPVITGGGTPLTYSWSPVDGLDDPSSPMPTARPVVNTDYILTVTTPNGCVASSTFSVRVSNGCIAPTISGLSTLMATCGNNNGAATIFMPGSTADYTYDWQPNRGVSVDARNQRDNLPAGGYVITIASIIDPSCTTQAFLVIDNVDGPEITNSIITPSNCEAMDGSVSLMPLLFDYAWSDGGSGASRNNLAPGTYFVTITDPGNPTCTSVELITVSETNSLSGQVTVLANPDCGSTNGSVQIDISGGTGPFVFDWPSGNTTNIESNLSAGTYLVNATDQSTGCTTAIPFILNASSGGATIVPDTTINLNCSGDNDGRIDYTVNYDPSFNLPADTTITDGQTSYTNGNLPVGNYCLVISDSSNCAIDNFCFTITEPDSLNLTIAPTYDCTGGGAQVDLIMAGGQGPYIFDWSDLSGNDDPEDRTGLADGNYTITVTDATGCSLITNLNLDGCTCTPPVVSSTTIMETACGNDDGMAGVNIAGDESAYFYTWTPDIGTPIGVGNLRRDLPFGSYQIVIASRQDSSCQLNVGVAITNSDGPQASYTSIPADCQAANGVVELSPSDHEYTWSDGMMTDTRADLAAGIYYVTFEDPLQAGCGNVLTVVVEENNPLTATHTVDVAPDCQMSNGAITINVANGSGSYTYSWEDGFVDTLANRNNLAAGTYRVTITDRAGDGCELVFLFSLNNNLNMALINMIDTLDVSCFGASDGGIVFEVNYDLSFAFPADTLITDGNINYDNGSLPAGDYCLQILDNTGCLAQSSCFKINEPDSIGLFFIVTPSCTGDGTAQTLASGGASPYNYDWQDVAGTNNTADRDSMLFGFYSLTVTDANGCMAIEDNLLIPACGDTCDYFNGMDSLILQAQSCDGLADLCIGVPVADQAFYDFEINGIPYTGNLAPCEVDSFVVYAYDLIFGSGLIGPYEVESWEVGDTTYMGGFNDIFDLVDSMNIWDPNGNWQLDTLDKRIFGGFSGNDYSTMRIRSLVVGSSDALGITFVDSPNSFAIQLDTGRHEVVVTSLLNGCSDTILAIVVCTMPDTIYIDQIVGQSDTLCLDTTELIGNTFTITNECPDGSFTQFEVLGDSCVVFTGINVGEETACVTICDEFGICDTTYVIITVNPTDDVVIDTIMIGETKTHCLDTALLDLTGPPVIMENICDSLSDGNVLFTYDIDSLCVSYLGLVPGADTACVRICDANNICDTVLFYIHVLTSSSITTETICDTVFINQIKMTCFDSSQLPGEIVSIRNVCEGEATDAVEIFLDPVSFCVEYKGLDIGRDTACIEICDDLGLCDTTLFCLFVTEYLEPPVAVDECDNIDIGRSKPIDVKSNDTLFGGITDIFILEPPIYGTIGLPGNPNRPNLDCSFTYNAGDEFCERKDSFTYVVCTPNGCDTATVCIVINCVDIVIFTAVSANGDGVNDVFFISGIEEFPNNELIIYNRWGLKVYETVGYMNDWDGKWDGDKDLPDGTYYYSLRLNDEENRRFTGFLELFR